LRTGDRIAALGQGLLAAAPAEREPLAMMLIELAGADAPGFSRATGTPQQAGGPLELLARIPLKWRARHAGEAMDALARGWTNLSDPMRRLAAGLGRDRWLRIAAQLASDPHPGARLAAAAIAHDTADPGLGKVVAALLSDEDQAVRKAGDDAMLRMTLRMLEHLPAELLGEDLARVASRPLIHLPAEDSVLDLERCILLGAVADAAWSFSSHRCRSALLCLLLLVDRSVATPMEQRIAQRMRRLLGEPNHPSHAPLRTVLKRTPCPILRERSLRWLVISPLASAALDRLAIADSPLEHERLLRQSALAMRPARAAQLSSQRRARALGGAADPSSLFPHRSGWDGLSE